MPFAVALVGLDTTLMFFGLSLAAGAVLSIPGMRPLDEQAARRAQELAPAVDVLAALGVFEDAPRAALERLAGASTEERVSAGTIVIREGDDPDDLFVIREGTFDVMASVIVPDPTPGPSKKVGELGRDDVFGEIGLVQHVARTATIVATTDAVVWRIPGPVFLDALSGSTMIPGAMMSTIAARLAGLGRSAPSERPPLPNRQ